MNMPTTFIMKSTSDHLELSGVYMKTQGNTRGVVQLVHGMSEYKERYLDFMRYLAIKGFDSVMTDHRGHGGSVRKKDDLGYFYEESGKYIVEDAHQLTLEIRKRTTAPIILFGHSMGSLVVRSYIKSYDKDIDALIVCGSPSKNPMAKMALTLVNVMEKFKGEYHRSALIQRLAFSSYPKRFNETYSENCWLSANSENVKAYDQDPLCGFVFTLNGFKNLFHLMIRVYDPNGWTMQHKNLPILFIAGEDDPCIDTKEKFQAAYELLKTCGYENIKHHLFSGMRHEILYEDNRKDVYEYIGKWLDDVALPSTVR